MIRTAPGKASGDAVSLVLLPHRSLTWTGLVAFLIGQSIVAGGYALLAAWRGNVFAPVFALLELGFVGWCMARVWKVSAAGQIITLTPTQLDIAPTSGPPKRLPAALTYGWQITTREPSRSPYARARIADGRCLIETSCAACR